MLERPETHAISIIVGDSDNKDLLDGFEKAEYSAARGKLITEAVTSLKSRKQAVAIALSEASRSGAKISKKKSS